MHTHEPVGLDIFFHAVADVEGSPGVVAGVNAQPAPIGHYGVSRHCSVVAEKADAGLDLFDPAARGEVATRWLAGLDV